MMAQRLQGLIKIYSLKSIFFYSCLSKLEVFLNEVSLFSYAANYPYRTFIETVLNFLEDAKHSYLQSTGFYNLKDEDKIIDAASKRKSKINDLNGRLNDDIFFTKPFDTSFCRRTYKIKPLISSICHKCSKYILLHHKRLSRYSKFRKRIFT